jgi:hypothetical protein
MLVLPMRGEIWEKFLGTAYWVGAIKRGTEGSYMQLQLGSCRSTKAQL